MKQINKKGFTLAEVLITLTIIGVVATITIPQLMSNVNQKALDESASLTLAKIREGTNRMKTQGLIKPYATTSDFVDKFTQYVKAPRRCTTSDMDKCFAEKFYTNSGEEVELSGLSTGADLGHDTYTSPLIGLGLANGTSIVMAFDPDCAYVSPYSNTDDTTSCISMLYDVNGFGKPNKIGVDIVAQNAAITLAPPCIMEGSICVIESDITYSPISEDPYTSNNNYWAGARDACLAMGLRLPKRGELNTLYGNKYVLGFDTGKYYWSSEEDNLWVAWIKSFYDGSINNSFAKSTAGVGARCVK
jgi:prepilin-type N-terminal cleavage/methylation domain-containing protein